jgi:oxygen-independent coproporphyrinogen III oxidase
MTGLYIHIPFCVSRCSYCDFYRVTAAEWGDRGAFLRTLDREFKRLPSSFSPETVFIGGGTPTVLEPYELERLLQSIHDSIDMRRVVEFSCEANPGTLTVEKLAVMRGGGIDRISMGVQSFNPSALQLLGRIHDAGEAIKSYELIREAGFTKVNLDLIQSVPGMSRDDMLADLEMVARLKPEHLSSYNLIYEGGTPMQADLEAGRLIAPDEDVEADSYYLMKERLEQLGYEQYEISNFALAGQACLHNILYWEGGDYFGCGPSAHSHWGGARFGNVSDLHQYCFLLERDQPPFLEVERLDAAAKARELLVMQLRMLKGVDLEAFYRQSGFRVEALCGDALTLYIDEGLLRMEGGRLQLTSPALFISNSVFSAFV